MGFNMYIVLHEDAVQNKVFKPRKHEMERLYLYFSNKKENLVIWKTPFQFFL